MKIAFCETHEEIGRCVPVLGELRPHLSTQEIISAVSRLAASTGYRLVYLADTEIKAVAGIRISDWLHTGKYLEIEELVTAPQDRSKGYGKLLFEWIVDYARAQNCTQVRLVSGLSRESAHRFYTNMGMQFEAKYFSLDL